MVLSHLKQYYIAWQAWLQAVPYFAQGPGQVGNDKLPSSTCLHVCARIRQVYQRPSARPCLKSSKHAAGREVVGSGGVEGGDPNGESDGPLHRDDSTFGEYMAALDGRSSSGNVVRHLSSSGTPLRQSTTYLVSDSCCITRGTRQACFVGMTISMVTITAMITVITMVTTIVMVAVRTHCDGPSNAGSNRHLANHWLEDIYI